MADVSEMLEEEPSDPFQFLTYKCAELSEKIYSANLSTGATGTPPPTFNFVDQHGGTPTDFRTAHWMILSSNEGKHVYVAFRGSVSVIDWMVNVSAQPARHTQHPNIDVHCGYQAEISREYDAIKSALITLAQSLTVPIEALVFTGHSKGGALAQVFMDAWSCDLCSRSEPCAEFFPRVLCIVFAAPMVFWSRDPSHIAQIGCRANMHNFIIQGDPVPVLQLLLTSNQKALKKLINNEANRLSIIGPAVVAATGVFDVLKSVGQYVGGYTPVGNIYVAKISEFQDLSGVEFDQISPDFVNWQDWACVRENNLSVKYHDIVSHHKILHNEYQSYLDSRSGKQNQKKKRRGKGLYVRNETADDLLVVLSLGTPCHWGRVPRNSIRYIGSGKVWFTVTASVYNSEHVPTQLGVAMTCVGGAVPMVIPATLLLTAAVVGRDLLFSGKNVLTSVYANGRTVVATKSPCKGVDVLMLSLTKTPRTVWKAATKA